MARSSIERVAPRRDLVLVCSGLDLAGGGRTLLARLLATACASFAKRHGLGCSILCLGPRDPGYTPPAPVWYASGRRTAFALRVLGRQLRPSTSAGRPALVFDLLGPARVQSVLPASLLSPYLVTLLGIEVWRPLRRSEATALSRAARRIAISETTRRRAAPYLPTDAEIDVLHLALEEREPAGERDEALLASLPPDFLLIVGRMAREEAYKGHDELLEALGHLQRHEATDPTPLVVVGEGADRARLEARTRELGVADLVRFTGQVSEATLSEIYRRSSLFVMPSRGEGFGLVFLEAMRAGKPCIAARDTAAEEIVVHQQTGLLVDPRTPPELARGIADLMADSATRRRLGEAGRERYRMRFSYPRFEARLHRDLERLSQRAAAGSSR